MKRKVLQALLGLALVSVVIQVILIAPHMVKDADDEARPAQTANPAHDPVDQSLQGMHTIETQDGGREWELWSDQADRLKDKEILKLKHVRTIFFAKSGVTFTTTGDNGTVESKTKNMRIEGNVITKSSNGYTFKSEILDYKSEGKLLTTQAPVQMIGPSEKAGMGMTLNGRGMRAHVEQGDMEILSDVHAEKNFETGKRVLIRSERALFNSNDRTAIFVGNTVLDMDTMRITGPSARFDYDPTTQEVRTLTVQGGAKVSDTDKWATADNLNVDFDKDRFTFWGKPRVVQNSDELKGEEIVFLDGGKQVEVHRARAKMDQRAMGKNN